MASITVDEATAAKVAAGEPIAVRTPDGQFVRFVWADPRLEPPPLPPGELERRLAEGGGRPLADILRDLEARG